MLLHNFKIPIDFEVVGRIFLVYQIDLPLVINPSITQPMEELECDDALKSCAT
jgi:hypothetical protein